MLMVPILVPDPVATVVVGVAVGVAAGVGDAELGEPVPPAGVAALLLWAKAEIIEIEIREKTARARNERKNLLVIGSL